jgi:phosphoglycerate dehydrogenase-like enzyme
MPREVLILDSAVVPHAGDPNLEMEVLRDYANVRELRLISDEHLSDEVCARTDAIILWHEFKLTAEAMKRFRKLLLIVRNGVGFDNVDVRGAASLGIAVANVPDYGTEEVADHAIALTLALIRRLRPLFTDISKGVWKWEAAAACRRLRGQVFGIVGCGRIGTAAALRAKALGFEVRFYDPYVPSGYEKAIGIRRERSLDALIQGADVLSIHVPLTEETRHLIDVPQLQSMKRTAFVVNTARGAVIRHSAMEQALREGWIAGAGLDVLENEPAGLELFAQHPNCLITPHSAFYSQESMEELRRLSAVVVREALEGRFINVVNGVLVPKALAQDAG